MSADNSNSASVGVGLPGLMFVLFTGLKLTNNIDWSWWWVTAPLWGTVALVFVIALLAALRSPP